MCGCTCVSVCLLCVFVGVCPDTYTRRSLCHRETRLGGLQDQIKGLTPLLGFKGFAEGEKQK